MTFVVLMICIALVVGTIAALGAAFHQGNVESASGLDGRRQISIKWLGLGFLSAGSAVFLFVAVFWPLIVRERIAEAEDITRKTFREKLGREPGTIRFDDTNRKTGWDGWEYAGTAISGDEIWDVKVSRSNDKAARKTRLMCEAVPRK